MGTAKGTTLNVSTRDAAGYLPIEYYGIIGNMRTCALVSMDGSIDFMCWPDFDSPSVFCRLLDKDKGGYFSIAPPEPSSCTTKQQYLPSAAILQTRYINEDGVVDVVDFFPRPKESTVLSTKNKHNAYREAKSVYKELKKWLVRRVECIRGKMSLDVGVFPAFDYAREPHTTTILHNVSGVDSFESKTVTFHSKSLKLQLDVTIDYGGGDSDTSPTLLFEKVQKEGMKGEGVVANFTLQEGQAISFVIREDIPNHVTENITSSILDARQHDTQSFWLNWLSKSSYKGAWREVVMRSFMILKLLTYEPTGAIVAAPTFSIPEAIGGVRNWDYRFSWVRDSSFTIYIFLRMGFTQEADAYMEFISEILKKTTAEGRDLPIMFTIRGETDLPEEELDHLDGYKGSRPVRIGNGAVFHKQFDTYGELMDAIYLYNKYGKPISWDTWVSVRKMLDHVLTILDEPDMSIWEVRNNKQHFVYSKVMLWVALDRGIRLAEKRCLPCPNRAKWQDARDAICEEVMEKGYNTEMDSFIQSYEHNTILDSSILIAPLVFFIAPNDPRFLNTVDKILLPPDKGGLTSAGLVSRYNTELAEDGVGGHEGAFSMCTFWLVEALTRASAYESGYLARAVNLFENMLSFSNHLSMFSEEIARSGEQLGNTPQAFSHLALISAAFNLDRARGYARR
ncbi:glycoside hydrolase family 15 protein [Daldinia caldariorum]|uniref:glycoside hydrolase family 15 protein n=1 Tax=Daldinia caldariorum TaxID=326644 RepID=UPI0020076DE8|nr:glycoside hydrolase family 15 protein [Daldinia caldariorum]KAI1465625.1 glycoside hydrolase family 15 protein [Daldinia caldariorum]